jgi:hypothetical protein
MSGRRRVYTARKQNPKHLRGELHENTILSRLPNGMPIAEPWNAPNYYRGHRPGSRIRTEEQRYLQQARQTERRNPAEAALRIAPVRNYNNTNFQNVRKGEMGWTEATNFVESPILGEIGAVQPPLAQATPLESVIPTHQPSGYVRTENQLYTPWQPIRRRAIRLQTPEEAAKEHAYQRIQADMRTGGPGARIGIWSLGRGAQVARPGMSRVRYHSPRNISRNNRKVKSLSLKKKRVSKKHSA